LEQIGIVERNIKRMINLIKVWLEWLPVAVADSQYKHLMDYIGHLQKEEKSTHHINRSLQTISHYYQFKNLPNVALTTRVKGGVDKAMVNPLTAKELNKIYESFEVQSNQNYFRFSDKIILGLIIYQALEMGDFMRLELKDIDLEKGTIYVPERRYRRSRNITLQSHQILPINTYILEQRPACQAGWRTGRNQQSDKLFSPQADDYHQLHWQFKKLSKHLKKGAKNKLGISIEKLSHLRQSRIAIWVKNEGLRKAQYLAGFRRVLSAERYRKANVEDLKEQVKKYHPFR